ncbi:peptidylprolyl isomerase [Pleurocapsa sp. PCC 7319]|uniref:peptidylprolyl isomerase n=1 Tax=Pleurocapsa sp. PCC 7319 TaxID=118161 RepID=UPI00034840E0|nr:peptidylprolyl isomerase [Pleurocapsa sp. PCC 7319]
MSVVLEVDNQVYTAEDLVPLLTQYQMLPKLAQEILIDKLIAEIKCTEEENTLTYNQFCQQNQLTSEEQVETWLNKQGMSREQLQNLITKRLRIDKFKEQNWGDQVEAHFIKRKSQLDRIVYSLIRVEKPELAQELYFRIKDDENTFSTLAMEYSQGTEAQTGGLIGPVELNAPHPKIAQILATCQPGQLIPPTRVGEWIVIVRLENYLSAKLDLPMRQRMLDELFREWLNQAIKQKVSYLSSPVSS